MLAVCIGLLCYPRDVATGWWLCMDQPPSVSLYVDTDRGGRFVAFDSDTSCSPVGCVLAQGRYDSRKVTRDDQGVIIQATLAPAEEHRDGFEPMDEHPTSSCVFVRFTG